MALEIERKFLVQGKPWIELSVHGEFLRQGYICTDAHAVVRVRLCMHSREKNAVKKAFITIKSHCSGISSHEYEYAIPVQEAEFMLDNLTENNLVEKIRYRIPIANAFWEVDEFLGVNAGLVLAEIELNSEDELISLPSFIGDEVTYDKRYSNAQLAKNPFNTW